MPRWRARLIHLFEALNRLGTTIVVATHDMGVIAGVRGAQMVRLESGSMVDPTGALKHPPHPPRRSALMLGWLNPPAPERRLLPGGRLQGPTPYVIAIMMFVTIIVAAAGLALANAADIVAAGVENRYSIQIADGARSAPRAIAAARASPGVTAVRPVSEASAAPHARTLARARPALAKIFRSRR